MFKLKQNGIYIYIYIHYDDKVNAPKKDDQIQIYYISNALKKRKHNELTIFSKVKRRQKNER